MEGAAWRCVMEKDNYNAQLNCILGNEVGGRGLGHGGADAVWQGPASCNVQVNCILGDEMGDVLNM